MTKTTQPFEETIPAPSPELYPNLARFVGDGGSLKVKRDGRLWYVTVSKGSTPDLGVTMASGDLEYALRQCDIVCRSWVMA